MCADAYMRAGILISLADLQEAFGVHLQTLYDNLTITTEQKVGAAKVAVQYKKIRIRGEVYVVLPRIIGLTMRANGIIKTLHIMFAPAIAITPLLIASLYDNQVVVVDYLCNGAFSPRRIAVGGACALLDMEAGLGKTAVAAGLIARIKLRTLFIVPKRPIMLQIVRELHAFLDNVTVVAFDSRKPLNDAAADIVVIVINSALTRDRTWLDGFSFVIYDEVHEYCSEERREIFRKTMTHVNFGMSATTALRQDGFDPIAHNELAYGGILYFDQLADITADTVQFDMTCHIVKYNGPPEYTQCLSHDKTGKLFMPYMNRQFVSDPHRTKLVLRYLQQLYDWEGPEGQKHCIYIFCENLSPLDGLYTAMQEAFDVYAPEITETTHDFVGGTKDAALVDIHDNARVLLTTYGYGGTGISINKMTAIVFLTPRKAKMQQIIGRIRRVNSDCSIPRVIIDIVDNKTPIRAQLPTRIETYKRAKYKAKIRYVTVDYDSI